MYLNINLFVFEIKVLMRIGNFENFYYYNDFR